MPLPPFLSCHLYVLSLTSPLCSSPLYFLSSSSSYLSSLLYSVYPSFHVFSLLLISLFIIPFYLLSLLLPFNSYVVVCMSSLTFLSLSLFHYSLRFQSLCSRISFQVNESYTCNEECNLELHSRTPLDNAFEPFTTPLQNTPPLTLASYHPLQVLPSPPFHYFPFASYRPLTLFK